MDNARTGKRKVLEPLIEPVPREPPLASASERTKPPATDFVIEAVHRVPVTRQTVVAIMSTENAAQPSMLFGQRRMHAPTLFRSHRVQLSRESLPVGPTLHDEAAVSTPRAVVREAEEGKRLRPPVAARFP